MQEKIPVSVLIRTKNEEANIFDCLESVKWAQEIIIVDSYSQDKTLTIAANYTDKIYQYDYNPDLPKTGWSLETPRFSFDWILAIDADERVTAEFRDELDLIVNSSGNNYAGYYVRFNYWFLGKFLKFGDPVKKVILFKKSKSHFEKFNTSNNEASAYLECGHENLIVEGKIAYAKNRIVHVDQRSLHFYFDRHNRYSTWEADLISNKLYIKRIGGQAKLGGNLLELRRLIKEIFLTLPFKPMFYFIYAYIFRLGFMDGYPGLCYNLCKAIYAYQIGLKVHETKIRKMNNK